MTEIQLRIQQALIRYQGIRRKRAALAGIGVFLLVIAFIARLDQAWIFEGGARWSGWVLGLIAAAWAAHRFTGPACPDETALAHRVESEAGTPAPVIATAIDPAVRQTAEQEELGRVLLERLDEQAEEALHSAPPNYQGLVQGPLSLAAGAVLALVALVLLQGGQGLQRILLPWQVSPYTTLSLQGPAEAIAEGASFTLSAQVSGVAVEQVMLYRGGSLEPLVMATPDASGRVELAVEGLDGPAEFVLRGGDGQSNVARVEPYLLPQIEAFEIEVTPPGYAAHASITETSPSFSVFRKSRLRYRIRLRAPAVSVTAESVASAREEEWVSPEERATLKRGMYGVFVGSEDSDFQTLGLPEFHADPEDPRVWESVWILSEPGDIVYRLAIEGEHGDRVRNEEAWRINVLADDPPKVRIASHNGGEVIQFGDEKVQFELSAVDDVRLAKVRLVYRKPGQPHQHQDIVLPADTRRTWSAAELLALAPLDLAPFDIVAVHAEAEDANLVDGPGIGRSEVVFLEVPLPESPDDGDGGGGGGGGGSPPINPLELQMEILRSTMVLPDGAPASDGASLAHDQRQNAEYTRMIEQAADGAGLKELGMALHKAWAAMGTAAGLLDRGPPAQAIPDEEAALGFLIDAAKILEDKKAELPPPAEGAEGMSFTLRPPKGGSAAAESEPEEGKEKSQEALRKLMEEVQRQLAEQEALNQSPGQPSAQASEQQALAQDARAAASQARGMPASSSGQGDPQAAAEELERAAGLQEDAAEALADGEAAAGETLGTQSAEALNEALQELAAQLKSAAFENAADTTGYERLVNDYLRSISYE